MTTFSRVGVANNDHFFDVRVICIALVDVFQPSLILEASCIKFLQRLLARRHTDALA